MKHGYGKITYNIKRDQKGKKSYQGEFKEDKPHGRGREIFQTNRGLNNRIFDGQFENGFRHGYGILTDNFIDIELDKLEAKERA